MQIIEREKKEVSVFVTEPIRPAIFYLPRSSQIEVEFAMQFAEYMEEVSYELSLAFGVGNPPDFGFGPHNVIGLPIENEKAQVGRPIKTERSFQRAFDAIRLGVVQTGSGNGLSLNIALVSYKLTILTPADLGPTYTQPFPGGR